MSASTWQCEFFVQVEPEFSRSGTAVARIKAVAMTQKRPGGRQRAGTVTFGITVRIPENAFLPLAPTIVIDVPESAVTVAPIQLEVQGG